MREPIDVKILDFKPDPSPERYERGTIKRIMWPVMGVDVLCDVRRSNPLNLFQEYVLLLVSREERDPDEIAATLALDSEIVHKVLAELVSQGFITRNRDITEHGEALLRDQAQPEQVAGMMFVDQLSGDTFIHPALVPRDVQPFVANAHITRNRIKITFGTEGKPVSVDAIKIRRGKTQLPHLAHELCLDAMKDGFRLEQEHLSSRDFVSSLLTGQVSRVEVMSRVPKFFYLYTYMFVPEGRDYWMICDPFGRGTNFYYRAQAERCDDLNNVGRSALERLSHVAPASEGVMPRQGALSEHLLAQAGNKEVASEAIGQLRKTAPELRSRLAAWWSLRSKRASQDFIIKAWGLLEHLISTGITQPRMTSHVDTALESLPPAPAPCEQHLRAHALAMGFEYSDELAGWFARTTRKHIKGALRDSNTTMLSVVSAALVLHRNDSDSPWHQLARVRPDFLVKLDLFRSARNQHSHEHAGLLDSYNVEELESLVLDGLHILYLESGPRQEEAKEQDGLTRDAVMEMQQRRAARIRARSLLNPYTHHVGYAQLRVLLTELEESRALMVRDNPEKSTHAANLVINAYKIAEYCTRHLCEISSSPTATHHDFSRSRDENTLKLESLHTDCGGEGALTQLGCANPDTLVRQVYKPVPRGVSARVWKLLLDAHESDAHPIRALLATRPDYFPKINDIVRERGHADAIVMRRELGEQTYQHTLELLHTTLSITSAQE